MELAALVSALAAILVAVAAAWICSRSSPTELLTGFDALQTQIRVLSGDLEELRAGWNRKTLEIDGLIEELLAVHSKVERSRKSIAARQSKEVQPEGPQSPEQIHQMLLVQARAAGINV